MTVRRAEAVLIVTAIAEELGPLLARSRNRARRGRSPDSFGADLGGAAVFLARTGDGRRRAESSMRVLLERHRPSAWIGAGFAGAVTPGAPAGTVLAVLDAGDAAWAARVLADGGALAASHRTLDRIAATASEKARLVSGPGNAVPGSPVVALDMETAGWLAAAAETGIPGLVVRVVSDAFDEEIPGFVAAASSDAGVDRASIVRHALTHPSAIGKLLAMRRRARFCAERLASFVEELARRGFLRT